MGSGPNGRIVKRDIDKVLATGTATTLPAPGISTTATPAQSITALTSNDPILANMPAFEAIPNSPMRQIIATRLTESARDIPHFNITVDAELDALLMVRKELNDNEGTDYKISINDLIVKAVAVALTRHPDCNAAYTNEAILKSLTLAVDHRCIDGATAAALMQEVKKIVEVPVQLML